MGKPIIIQRRGRSKRFEAPSFNYRGRATSPVSTEPLNAEVIDLVHCPGHSAPLAQIEYDGQRSLIIAPEGMRIGDSIIIGSNDNFGIGNIMKLDSIPEGSLVHNIETVPGDGGKLARGSGTFARVLMKSEQGVTLQLPSGKKKVFKADCRASIGVVAGSGRKEKPLLKAGKNYYALRRARKRMWPVVRKVAMNSVAHPFGGKHTHKKGRPNIAPKNAPPGRNVGKIRPRRTGRQR